MRAALAILALAASACAAAPPYSGPLPESDEVASTCGAANAVDVKTCGKEVDIARDQRKG